MGSRRIVGFSLDEHHDADVAQAALQMADAVRGGKDVLSKVIMHTDQGTEGEFNPSSQHLDHGGVQWDERVSSCRTRACARSPAQSVATRGRSLASCGATGDQGR